MTREEILAMEPGGTMNAEIATEVMGYKIHEFYAMYLSANGKRWIEIPPYSTDISAAWEVLEKLTEKGAEINVGYCDVWDCCIDYPIEINWRATAETAPEAICKAALIAVMGAFE